MTQPVRALLWPFSALYGAATGLRNLYYDHLPAASSDAGVPVISIGNITTGGTGKTPLVIEIVSRLLSIDRNPAILTRGYRGSESQPADEVLEYGQALPDVPVVVDPDRVRGAATARREHSADCLVLDDGFQHRRIRRTLDVVVVDALDPWGGARLIPAGRMREAAGGIRRADLVVISRRNLLPPGDDFRLEYIIDSLHQAGCQCPIIPADIGVTEICDLDGSTSPVGDLVGRRVFAVCGIGNPAGFFGLIRTAGGEMCGSLCFADHHRYQSSDLPTICERAERVNAEWVVTTRKDWVKLAPLAKADWSGPPLRRLNMSMELSDPDDVVNTLLRQALEPTRS